MLKRLNRIGLHRALMIVLAAWAVLVIAPDFLRVVNQYGELGFYANNDGVIYDVTPQRKRESGINEGDRIDLQAMRCTGVTANRCADLLAILGGMGGVQYVPLGRPVTVQIASPHTGGTPRSVAITPTPVHMGLFDDFMLALDDLAGIALILLAATLVWQAPNLMTWGFFLYAMWFNSGQYFATYAFLQHWPKLYLAQEGAQALALALGYVGFVIFALRFPNNATEARWKPYERLLPFVFVILAALEVGTFANAFGYETETIARAAYFAGCLAYLFVVVTLIVRALAVRKDERQRIWWILAGCAIGLSAFIVADSIESTTLWNVTLNEGWLDLLYLGNVLLGYAVFRAVREHRINNVFVPLWRGALLVVLLGGLLLVIETVHRVLEHSITETGLAPWVFSAVTVGLTMCVGLIHETLKHQLHRVFHRSFVHAKEHLLQMQQEFFKKTHEPSEIETALVERPATDLRLASAAVFRNERGAFRRHVKAVGWDHAASVLAQDHPVVRACAGSDKPLRLREDDPSMFDGMPAQLARPVFAVAVRSPFQTFAIALYGPHAAGDNLSRDECEVLEEFAASASISYEHNLVESYARENELLKQQLQATRLHLSPSE